MAGLFFLLRLVLLFVLLSWLVRALRRWRSSSRTTEAVVMSDLQQCPVCQHYLTAQSDPCARDNCPKKRGRAAAFLFAFVFILGWSASALAESGGRYLVQVDGENVDVSLFVNDIPVERWALDAAGSAGASLNHWLRQGNNSIRLKVSLIDSGQPTSFHAHVWFLGLTGAGGMSTVDLLQADGVPKSAEGFVVGFNVSSAPALALWTTDPAAQPDSVAIAKKIDEFCVSLSSAFAEGKSPFEIAPLALERQDSIRAYGGTATLPQLDVAGQSVHTDVEVSSVPRAVDMAFDSLSQTGVIRVTRKDGTPLFVARIARETFAVPALLVGRKNGVWFVLRRSF